MADPHLEPSISDHSDNYATQPRQQQSSQLGFPDTYILYIINQTPASEIPFQNLEAQITFERQTAEEYGSRLCSPVAERLRSHILLLEARLGVRTHQEGVMRGQAMRDVRRGSEETELPFRLLAEDCCRSQIQQHQQELHRDVRRHLECELPLRQQRGRGQLASTSATPTSINTNANAGTPFQTQGKNNNNNTTTTSPTTTKSRKRKHSPSTPTPSPRTRPRRTSTRSRNAENPRCACGACVSGACDFTRTTDDGSCSHWGCLCPVPRRLYAS